MDKRLEQLHQWIKETLGVKAYSLEPASADASFRRYFRLSLDAQTRIIMDAPPDKEDTHPFIDVAQALRKIGINAPEIFHPDPQRGFLLLGDLGNTTYLSVLKESNADVLYHAAIDALILLQGDFPQPDMLPSYDRELLRREMNLFSEWYLQRHLKVVPDTAENQMLQQVYTLLEESALAQPRVAVHRDYHSRNLMVCDRNPGVLDFQDAVYGPISYDLVSLLRDCYIRWPSEQVHEWLAYYRRKAAEVGLPVNEEKEFIRWFDLMGVQRHLKASGIFARLNHRDGKPGYLQDIPRTMGYVMEVCGHYAELSEFNAFLQEKVVPHWKD